MEARPLADETDSILALQPLREAVADCLDALAPIDRYLLEACHTERVTYRDMAIRIGYTKSHAYRLTRRAEIHLRDECLQHPVVLAYLGVEASIVPHVDASIVSTVVEVSCERTG
jgi:DNA-directed RNA polymerase specialized sigma24 family protein